FAMDAMTWLVSHMADDKRLDIRMEAAIAKLFCTEESWKVVDSTLQIRGGRGYETGPSLKDRGEAAFPVERAMRDSRINTILEGTSEIMHLFIAREALDSHLSKIKYFMDPEVTVFRKASAAIPVSFGYMIWYLRLWLPPFGNRFKLVKPLDDHMYFVQVTAKRLARELFHKMVLHQQKLAQKQNILNRFVDIGADLFAVSCVCSYADSLHKKGEVKDALKLADLFCRQTRRRILSRFKDVSHNDDRSSYSVAKKLLNGDYEWLEDDIIKGR
ncbi:MAG: acyl-CoA dehydrogenase family protein, partial [Candidatus Omnitrophota bacterium]|nr:acyl-CoA dehydrogenase family protein [Candidatus Omnitrophota bacterium]